MKLLSVVSRIILTSALIFCSGCAHCIASESEDMLTMGAALSKLTTAVEAKVRYENAPADLKDQNLLQLATQHDPRLLDAFSGYLLKAVSQNNHAIVLVCTPDGKKALLEDAGCTSKMDLHWWRDQPDRPCVISEALCAANASQ